MIRDRDRSVQADPGLGSSAGCAAGLRVLFLAGGLGTGGAVSYVATKARWLIANGADVLVVSGGGPGESRVPQQGTEHKIVEGLRSPAITAARRQHKTTLAAIAALVEAFGPSLIEADWPSSAEYAELISARCDVPLLVAELNYHLNRARFKPCIAKWVANGQLVVGFHDALFAIEQATGVDTASCPFLPIPISLPTTPLRASPPAPGETAVVATVSRLDRSKRYLEYFIRQVVDVDWPGPLTVRLVGDGDDRRRLERIASRVSSTDRRIEFVGMTFDLRGALQGSHLFVGQGTAAVQAASLGLPVILASRNSEAPTSPGLFGEPGSYSIGDPFPRMTLIPYQDRVEHLLRDSQAWHEAADQGRASAWTHFDVERVMAKQLILYRALVDRWASGSCRKDAVVPHMTAMTRLLRRAWDALPPRAQSAIAARR